MNSPSSLQEGMSRPSWTFSSNARVSSKSEAMERLLAGVEVEEGSVDSAWGIRGDEEAEEGAERE